MKLVATILALAAVCSVCLAAEQHDSSLQQQAQQQQQQQQQAQQQLKQAAPAGGLETNAARQPAGEQRHGRQIAPGGYGNQLYNEGANSIDHSSNKKGADLERQAVQELLTTKNIFKALVKLLFGNPNEVTATSRSVLGVLSMVLETIKEKLQKKARSAGTARTIRDSADEVAAAGISMLQGYVKSVLATDTVCAQRYLCEASRAAVRDGRDLGYMISSVGGYATSYLLDSSKSPSEFQKYQDALRMGRDLKEPVMNTPCNAIYKCQSDSMAIPKTM